MNEFCNAPSVNQRQDRFEGPCNLLATLVRFDLEAPFFGDCTILYYRDCMHDRYVKVEHRGLEGECHANNARHEAQSQIRNRPTERKKITLAAVLTSQMFTE